MTKKRFNRVGGYVYDNDKCISHFEDVSHRDDIITLLNAQDKQIFLLKCVIQTITAESMDKNISHKRILEIKKHWYDKLCGDVE